MLVVADWTELDGRRYRIAADIDEDGRITAALEEEKEGAWTAARAGNALVAWTGDSIDGAPDRARLCAWAGDTRSLTRRWAVQARQAAQRRVRAEAVHAEMRTHTLPKVAAIVADAIRDEESFLPEEVKP